MVAGGLPCSVSGGADGVVDPLSTDREAIQSPANRRWRSGVDVGVPFLRKAVGKLSCVSEAGKKVSRERTKRSTGWRLSHGVWRFGTCKGAAIGELMVRLAHGMRILKRIGNVIEGLVFIVLSLCLQSIFFIMLTMAVLAGFS